MFRGFMCEDAGIVTGRHKGELYDFRSSLTYIQELFFCFYLCLKTLLIFKIELSRRVGFIWYNLTSPSWQFHEQVLVHLHTEIRKLKLGENYLSVGIACIYTVAWRLLSRLHLLVLFINSSGIEFRAWPSLKKPY